MIILDAIKRKIEQYPEKYELYEDYFSACVNLNTHDKNRELRSMIGKVISTFPDKEKLWELYKRSLLFSAPHFFDEYLLYMEIDRPPKERFYQPRRKVLKPIVDKIQALLDDELDELFISLPPRVGKTTLLLFLTTFIIGKESEISNLYCAFSDTITKAFYNGALEIIEDKVTYKWQDIFPEAKLVQTNSQDETINIDRKKRYPSMTCRSLYGTLNGACDVRGFMIADDLLSGIEEVLNPERLRTVWGKVDNNLISRGKEGCKILWCGTRWAEEDPIGLRIRTLEGRDEFKSRRYDIINIPALNEDGESNFDYDYGVGFSTDTYIQRRSSFEENNDVASWLAQYMGEPINREGVLFRVDDFRYYNGELPEGRPDRIFMAVDPAFGGGDFVAAPLCFKYGDDIYVHDVVYDDGDKSITQKLLADMVEKYGVQAMQIEANKMTEAYTESVGDLLRDRGIRINLTSKPAPTKKGKEERIFDKAPDIRKYMIFRSARTRSPVYEKFFKNVITFSLFGKNIHDDAPDSLAMAIDMAFHGFRSIEIFTRRY